jgi:hypothetical protein
MKLNKGKWDSQNETRKNYKKTKQNFAFDETKRNKAKFCCFLYRKTSEISQNNFFRFVYCFAKQKRMRTENPSQQEQDFPEHVFRGFSGAPAEMRTVLEQPHFTSRGNGAPESSSSGVLESCWRKMLSGKSSS